MRRTKGKTKKKKKNGRCSVMYRRLSCLAPNPVPPTSRGQARFFLGHAASAVTSLIWLCRCPGSSAALVGGGFDHHLQHVRVMASCNSRRANATTSWARHSAHADYGDLPVILYSIVK